MPNPEPNNPPANDHAGAQVSYAQKRRSAAKIHLLEDLEATETDLVAVAARFEASPTRGNAQALGTLRSQRRGILHQLAAIDSATDKELADMAVTATEAMDAGEAERAIVQAARLRRLRLPVTGRNEGRE